MRGVKLGRHAGMQAIMDIVRVITYCTAIAYNYSNNYIVEPLKE